MEWPEIYKRLKRDPDDTQAWDALEQHVRAWARPQLWDLGWHVVEDAVADTCSTVVLCIARARAAETFSNFTYGHYLNVRRRVLSAHRWRHAPLDGFDPPAPPEAAEPDERVAMLRACLDGLPPRDRQAVQLRYFEDHSSEQIAAALGVTAGNARRIVFNGLARLRRCLAHRLSGLGADADIIRKKVGEDVPAL